METKNNTNAGKELFVVEGLLKKYLFEGKVMAIGYIMPVEDEIEARKWREYMQSTSATGKVVYRIRRITEEEANTKFHGCRMGSFDKLMAKTSAK